MRTRLRHLSALGLAAALLAATALLATPASPAYAHNVLRKATPAQDAELTKAPTKVTLDFLQKLNPSFTTVTLSDADKQPVATSEPEVDGTKATVTIESTLPNGVYTVAYRVVSNDGHPVQGSYKFTVADPSATAEPSPSPSPSPEATEPAESPSPTAEQTSVAPASPAASDSSGGGAGTAALLTGAAVLAALAIGAVVVLLRRRRSGDSAA
ncbi:copper resistance CopC family protein [Micromonospora maris]|uniref:Copper resistance protein CopC n=1 Tax=Micromonospora maris TaxID=1003110 RepID=A0A9X0I6K7_9ACTN|nr:copper resistance CopC family protein [Micromonospora maris]AEB42494.1 copper resistance protein CopC [Micromonospora maris AB-18-032]KUJ47950.1 copper resistance protein CopC [Micromonospora maris]